MKIDKKLVEKIQYCSDLIDIGEFNNAFNLLKESLNKLNRIETKESTYYILLSNIAGFFADLGSMGKNIEASRIGFNLMKDNKENFIEIVGESDFYYNFANAKASLISISFPFDNDFSSIEELVELKNYYWKSVANSNSEKAEHLVNLANALKKQFRLVESIKYYDEVISLNLDIPQAWVNRSDALIMLNMISNTYSIKMLKEIKKGFSNALNSNSVPPQWKISWASKEEQWGGEITEAQQLLTEDESDLLDEEMTTKEYNELSEYRKFSLIKKLTLSEHSLYCPCIGSSKDNLTILMSTEGVAGDFIIPMENILNRLKSEFIFARQLYYEYYHEDEKDNIIFHESSFAELYNDELLGIKIEKIRSAFRLCFGILDKIGVAICELYNVYPQKDKKIYFQSFWQLDKNGRRDLFENIKSPGLLALYSIASDLNEKKDGELSFFKDWRNKLEHAFLVVHSSEFPNDIYNSYSYMKEDILFIKEDKFIKHLEQLLQITRSAIFSFVYMVREHGMHNKSDEHIYLKNKIYPKTPIV